MSLVMGTVGFAMCLLVAVAVAMDVAIKALAPEDDIASPEDVVARLGALSEGDAFTRTAVQRAEQKHRALLAQQSRRLQARRRWRHRLPGDAA